ncbi:MAG: hypothetical protein AUJ72_02365 [Candidatus Omnitrophica bacterium CG1_02_46_14]|nr:MAG: hypothetical protein AUJ72_02365 [Candidatus Omnitrophica bacterium CG1_02_46_14]
MKKIAIGIDIGGTNVKLGLVSPQGRILERMVFFTASVHGREAMLDLLVCHIRDLTQIAKKKHAKIMGLGIGAPGPIDVERGFVYFFPNISGWKNTRLKSMLEKRLKLKVSIDNDANVMALAEVRFGAGKGFRNVIALTLGTGIGGGLVIDGKLFHGSVYSAAEIGHIVINENGILCGCGSHGCVETYVGNDYLIKEVKRRLMTGRKSLLNSWIQEGKKLTPLLVRQAAERKDTFSIEVWKKTGEHLGTALAGLVNTLNPELIILGGGVAQKNRFLFKSTAETIKKKAFPIAARSVRVVPATLGVDAGLIGAAALIF